MLPTSLLVDSVLGPLNSQGVFYYIAQRGNERSGLLLLKLNGLGGEVKLTCQQRNFMTDVIEWVNPMRDELVSETVADQYIDKQKNVDPDLWVIEIEDRNMHNPFEEFTNTSF